MRNKVIKAANKYGYEFKEKNSKGNYELCNPKGHIISSPTLSGLYNCLMTFGEEK